MYQPVLITFALLRHSKQFVNGKLKCERMCLERDNRLSIGAPATTLSRDATRCANNPRDLPHSGCAAARCSWGRILRWRRAAHAHAPIAHVSGSSSFPHRFVSFPVLAFQLNGPRSRALANTQESPPQFVSNKYYSK
jgi:hypothetical protein